jgi:NAD(P)-dependent dehydrogenase (short-subunit alcohol dehydrogenase family)
MKDLQGKVAVITGAASGFGREFARALAAERAKLVLADVDEKGLQETIGLLPEDAEAIAMRCDVSAAKSLDDLADAAYARFGAAHLVFNNAGVAVCGPAWTATLEDWKWVLDINLMGVVHGVRSFVPRMIASGEPGHVINTASVAGLLSIPGSAVYCVSKHAVVTLSECLRHDLRVAKAPVGVSVLCPAFVPTGIADSARNRPTELAATNPLGKVYEEGVKKAVAAGRLSAADIARTTLDAVRNDRFYVIPHQKTRAAIETRMQDILAERDPTDISRPVFG